MTLLFQLDPAVVIALAGMLATPLVVHIVIIIRGRQSESRRDRLSNVEGSKPEPIA